MALEAKRPSKLAEHVRFKSASQAFPRLNRYLVEITIPKAVWAAARKEDAASVPVGWDAEPASRSSIDFGTTWIVGKATALLCLPSVIVPEEINVLINPAHPSMASITSRTVRKWLYDPRLRRP